MIKSVLPASLTQWKLERCTSKLNPRQAFPKSAALGGRRASRVTRYELGTSEPDFATANKLAKELGVPLAYLLADNDTLADIILAVASMSPAQQRRMAAELRAKAKR
ncbi:MAG: XRE family transcriptional regulator [Rhodanobacter sp.]|nr:MAG: XRE family transcriptional regulator [Rhodanobacter sp.]